MSIQEDLRDEAIAVLDDEGVHTDPDFEEGDLDERDLDTRGIVDWRVAESLKKLQSQVNSKAPNRSKKSDGTIGDAAHATRNSDHNPWVKDGTKGVVTALDITHDPANGCDAGQIAEAIRSSKDSRVKYMIWNKKIASHQAPDGQPRGHGELTRAAILIPSMFTFQSNRTKRVMTQPPIGRFEG
jgi:hypothetical protein